MSDSLFTPLSRRAELVLTLTPNAIALCLIAVGLASRDSLRSPQASAAILLGFVLSLFMTVYWFKRAANDSSLEPSARVAWYIAVIWGGWVGQIAYWAKDTNLAERIAGGAEQSRSDTFEDW